MDKTNIINVYKFATPNGTKSFFYSVKREKLSYKYYILSEESGFPQISRIKNAISILQNNNIELEPVTKDDPDYNTFITSLALAINTSIPTLSSPSPRKQLTPNRIQK